MLPVYTIRTSLVSVDGGVPRLGERHPSINISKINIVGFMFFKVSEIPCEINVRRIRGLKISILGSKSVFDF
jgi:hypothetical protein